MVRRALITGISGQDGTYLAESLRSRGVEVVGVCLRPPSARVLAAATVHQIDICDSGAIARLVAETRPDEIYHLAAYHQSSAATGIAHTAADEEAEYLKTNLLAVQNLLASIVRESPRSRVFLAGSCHMFGEPLSSPQDENTPFVPNSLYGLTKVAAGALGRIYREKHGLFCVTGILFNHESPLRGPAFITSRLARGAAEVASGRMSEILVGDLDAQVDWGFAGDYVDAMTRMLAASDPQDFIIATGRLHTVREFATIVFARAGLDASKHVRQNATLHRPVSRRPYHGNPARIRDALGWSPATSFEEIARKMADHYLEDTPRTRT